MTRIQRIRETVLGLIMALYAIVLVFGGADSYPAIVAILSLIYTFRGLSTIVYYFSMARFMTGGRTLLYKGVILLDFGIITSTLTDVPRVYVLLYLIMMHAFSGAVEILRAREAAAYGGSWKLKMFHGIMDLIMALVCVVFIRLPHIAVLVFAATLFYSAVLRIISAFRKTKLVYIR